MVPISALLFGRRRSGPYRLCLEAYLEQAGIEVAGPFGSCADALSWAKAQTPALAILDFKLRDGPCTELAENLMTRNVPIIVYSGLARGADMPRELDGVTWLEKPADCATLMAEAARLAPSLGQRNRVAIAPFP